MLIRTQQNLTFCTNTLLWVLDAIWISVRRAATVMVSTVTLFLMFGIKAFAAPGDGTATVTSSPSSPSSGSGGWTDRRPCPEVADLKKAAQGLTSQGWSIMDIVYIGGTVIATMLLAVAAAKKDKGLLAVLVTFVGVVVVVLLISKPAIGFVASQTVCAQ